MSNNRYFTVRCDKCETETGPAIAKPRAIRAELKVAGWKLGKQKDFCPGCAKDIAAAVENAKAGNL